jgi:thymidine kinase
VAKLHFYYSAMNAGKSTVLLQSDYNYRERGMETLLFTPEIDTRYGVGKIYSRLGLMAEAIAFSSSNLFDYTQGRMEAEGNNIQCVLVDEAQFLNKAQVWQLTEIVDEFDIPVLAYGLRSDFLGEPFEGSQYLLAWAEKVSEIKTICHCGKKATMNLRVDESGQAMRTGDQIVIGGNERYVATCRQHFKAGKASAIQIPAATAHCVV